MPATRSVVSLLVLAIASGVGACGTAAPGRSPAPTAPLSASNAPVQSGAPASIDDSARPGVADRLRHPPRILVYTQTLGWRHDSIPTAVATLRTLAEGDGVAVDHTEDPADFDEATLQRYAAVVFANTTGNVLDPVQRAAFQRFVARGGGFLGVHAAADTGYDWPWYGRLVAAWFLAHPPGLQSARVHFTAAHRPPGGEAWRVTDELYDYRAPPRGAVRIVARIDERDDVGGRMGDDHPIAWCHDEAGGRAWYTGLGHDRALYADPVFRAHLQRGLRWVLGHDDAC